MSLKPIFLTKVMAAEVLAISLSTLYELERNGKLRPRKISGGRVGYLLREIEAFAESCPVSDIPPPPNTGARKPKKRQAPQDDRLAA